MTLSSPFLPIQELGIPHTKTLILIFLITLVYYLIIQKIPGKKPRIGNTKPWPKVRGALPLIGNRIPGGIYNFTKSLEQWASSYGAESGIYEFRIFHRRVVVLCTEERIDLLEGYRPYKVTRRENISKAMKSLGFDGVFTAEGSEWRHDRRLVGPALNRKNVRDYVSAVKKVASRLVDKWRTTMKDQGYITINPDILSCTMDVISLVAFAKDTDRLRKGGGGLQTQTDFNFLIKRLMFRVFAGSLPYWKIPIVGQYLDGAGWKRDRLTKIVCDIIREHEEEEEAPNVESESWKQKSKTFLHKLLLERKKEDSYMNDDRLIGNLFTMFAAGSETTYVTVCSSLYQIASDKTLQDEIATEILALPSLQDKADLDNFEKDLPRTRSLIYEVLRLLGPTPIMFHENKETIEIFGESFPPKTAFAVLCRYASCRSSQVPRGMLNSPPNQFCARRWLLIERNFGFMERLTVSKPSYKTGFRPFGSGLRVCPGRDLAETEALVVLSFILKHFEIQLRKGHPPLHFSSRITETPDDIQLVMKPREL